MEPSAWNRRLQRLAWWPIPLLLLAMGVFWTAELGTVYEPPHLMMALNLLFMMPVALFVAYQTGRSFLLRGYPGLLWFSCGILFWGSAGPLGGFLLPHGPGVAVTVHNILVGLAAVCHLAGIAFAAWPRTALRWPELWLAGAYAGTLALMVAVVMKTLSGEMPVFFVQGEGGTLLRQIVLGSAVALFTLAAILLMRNPGGTRSEFQYWYALALLLIAVGLFGALIQSNVGSALGWTGRLAQSLGSLYLMVAAVVGMRENRDWGRLLEAALGQATQRFEELLSRYELVLAGAQDAIWDWDVVHQSVLFSPQWKAMRGYAEDEVGDHENEWSAGIHPDDAPRVFARLQEHFAGQTPVFAEEYRIRCKDGSWKWIFDRGLVQRDATGRVVRMAGSESDITERKQIEDVIRRNGQFKQAILDAMTAHVAVVDREGYIVAINQSWRGFAIQNSRAEGQPVPRAGIGVNYREVCCTARGEGAEDARVVLAGINAVLAGEAESFSHEYACHSPEKHCWFSLVVTPLGDGSGGVVIAHTDITNARQLAEQLRDERDRFTRIAATVPGVICSFRRQPNGNVSFPYASPAIRDLYGLPPETLAKSAAPLWVIIHPDDFAHLDASIEASAQTMTPWRDEFRVRHPSKGEIWVEGHSMPVRESDGSLVWHGYVQDITERKRAETALRAALEAQEVLLREVHHRVKNNLAAIIGLLELQRERALDPVAVSQLEELGHRIRSMALIHEMLYQSGNLSRVDFHGYLEALVGHLRDALDPSGAIRIHITAPKVWMNLDTAIPCGLIVNELVTNALKYAFPDHRRAASACEIIIAANWDGSTYTLTTTDNGVGLPADLDWTTTPTLGLRLIRMLGQHQLRGQITCDGTRGTQVSLRFGSR